MVDHLFNDKSGYVDADDMRIGDKCPERSNLVIHIKIFRPGEFVQAVVNLFLKTVFICCFNKIALHQFHGNGVAQGVHAINDSLDGKPSGPLF